MFVIENCDPTLHHAHVTYLLDFLLLMVPICASLSKLQVNLHILKMLLVNQQNYVLAHQVNCLAMLFDYYLDEASPSSERTNCTSVVDIGLCKPVTGRFLGRSFRGRDRRKMISWKDMKLNSSCP